VLGKLHDGIAENEESEGDLDDLLSFQQRELIFKLDELYASLAGD
jgi:hypothetical protein